MNIAPTVAAPQIIPSRDPTAMTRFFAAQGLTYAPANVHSVESEIDHIFLEHRVRAASAVLADGFVPDGVTSAAVKYGLPVPRFMAGKRSLHERIKQALDENVIADVGICRINDRLKYGCFALSDLPRHAFIAAYTGEVYAYHGPGDDTYTLGLNRLGLANYLIDARRKGNETRYINHAQPGVVVRFPDGRHAYAENVCGEYVYYRGAVHYLLFATRDIRAGEELRMDYGGDYVWRYFGDEPDTRAFWLKAGELVALETFQSARGGVKSQIQGLTKAP